MRAHTALGGSAASISFCSTTRSADIPAVRASETLAEPEQ